MLVMRKPSTRMMISTVTTWAKIPRQRSSRHQGVAADSPRLRRGSAISVIVPPPAEMDDMYVGKDGNARSRWRRALPLQITRSACRRCVLQTALVPERVQAALQFEGRALADIALE